MKKILMTALLALSISASCFAAGASGRFAAEEKAADALVAALSGDEVTYDNVSRNFTQGLKKEVNQEKFAGFKNNIRKTVGNVKNANLVFLNRQFNPDKGYTGIEEMIYMGTVGKDKLARILIVFVLENNSPKINGFRVDPVQVQRQEAPAKK